jgi:hypothetical protein
MHKLLVVAYGRMIILRSLGITGESTRDTRGSLVGGEVARVSPVNLQKHTVYKQNITSISTFVHLCIREK